jgi:hypothetical protein
LTIDSSLGVTFSYVFTSVKDRDWIKAICYGLLTLLLAIVVGTITNVDTFSHAIHSTINSAIIQVGLDVKLLTTLRAIAVVGFVLMSRLKDVSFKELYAPPIHQTSTLDQSTRRGEKNQKNTHMTDQIKELLLEAPGTFHSNSNPTQANNHHRRA